MLNARLNEYTGIELKLESNEDPGLLANGSVFAEFLQRIPTHEDETLLGNNVQPDLNNSRRLGKPNQANEALVERRRSKVRDFRCFFCNKVFSKINLKKDHIKKEHAAERICQICNTKKPSALATEQCLKDHKFGFDYLCQVRNFTAVF